MKTIDADFNALTEQEHIRLTSPLSQRSIASSGTQPGDWVWLADAEMIVAARLAQDPRYGLLGIPVWKTLVHLDSESSSDLDSLRVELESLLLVRDRSPESEVRLLQALIQFESKLPAHARNPFVDFLRGRVAFSLANVASGLGYGDLALIAAEEAWKEQADCAAYELLFLNLLLRADPMRAMKAAESAVARGNAPASVVAACIRILSDQADRLAGTEFTTACNRVHEWADRFDAAPERDKVSVSTLALVRFCQGLADLGLNRVGPARQRFLEAIGVNPIEPVIRQALELDSYGQEARRLVGEVRRRPFTPAA